MSAAEYETRHKAKLAEYESPFEYHNCDENELAQHLFRKQHNAILRAKHTLQRSDPKTYDNALMKQVFDYEVSPFGMFKMSFYSRAFSRKPLLAEARRSGTVPEHINNENTTFGKPTQRADIAELITPNKSVAQVNREFYAHHERSLKTHGRYLPAERVRRHYNEHFNENQVFGKRYKKTPLSDVLKHFALRVCNTAERVQCSSAHSSVQMYGILKFPNVKRTPKVCIDSAPTICAACDPCAIQESSHAAIKRRAIEYMQQLRDQLTHDATAASAFVKLQQRLSDYACDYISLSRLFDNCRKSALTLDEQLIKHALAHFKVIKQNFDDGTVILNYKQFLNILNPNYQLQLDRTDSRVAPAEHTNIFVNGNSQPVDPLTSTYLAMCADHANVLYSKPARKRELQQDKLLDETARKYGLQYTDYELPRTKPQLERVFRKVFEHEPALFNVYWQQAYDKFQPANQLISVNDMRAVLKGKMF